MATILGLMQTIKEAVADLEDEVKKLQRPFAGAFEAEEEVAQERNIDHFKDEQI